IGPPRASTGCCEPLFIGLIDRIDNVATRDIEEPFWREPAFQVFPARSYRSPARCCNALPILRQTDRNRAHMRNPAFNTESALACFFVPLPQCAQKNDGT